MGRFFTRRWLVRAGIAVVVLAALWSATALIVPPTFKSRAERIALEILGRRLTIGDVAFNPWTLALRVDDIALASASDAAPPQLQIRQLRSKVSVSWVFRLAPVIDRLEIDAPMVRLTRLADGRYDVDDVLARLAAAPAKEGDEPVQFALHNIVVHGGAADFVDQPLKTTHRLRDFELGVPFLSALPSEREINVEPRLAFTLDGSRFDSAAVATPFAERGAGTVKIRLDRFDVGPWLGYLPKGLPVRLQSALVSADLSLAFEQRPKLALRLAGDVGVADLKVADAEAHDLLRAGSVKVRIEDLRPLERIAKLARIDIDAPQVLGVRNAAGKVNLLLAAETPSGGAVPLARVPLPTTAASAASVARAPGQKPASAASGTATATPAPGWKASVAALSIRAGQFDWRDATTSPPAELAVQGFSFDAQAIAWPLEAPVVFKGEGVVGAAKDQGKLAFSGQGNAAGATVKIGLDELPLVVARPYLQGAAAAAARRCLEHRSHGGLEARRGRAAAAHRCPADRGRQAGARRGEDAGARSRAGRAARCPDRHRDAKRSHRQAGAAGAAAATRPRHGRPMECRDVAGRGGVRLDRSGPAHRAVLVVCDHCVRGRRSRAGIGAFCVRAGRVRTVAPEPRHPGDRQGPGQLHRPQPRRARRARPA